MSFISAMNSFEAINLSDSDIDENFTTKVGVNGSDVYTTKGFGNRITSFYTMLNRDMSKRDILKNMSELFKQDKKTLVDLLVLIFQTRDIRGGKGERDLFYDMIVSFLNKYQENSLKILELIPEYGYWQDLWKIYSRGSAIVQENIDKIVKDQFTKDLKSDNPSLLVKWLPREKSKFDSLAKHFADILFSDISNENNSRLRLYRKTVSDLNRKSDTTEIKMCGGSWSAITPKNVPGRLLKKNKKAFLNEKAKNSELRYPNNQDRNECREHFMNYISDLKSGKQVAKGADVLMPHELVAEYYNYTHTIKSQEENDIIQAQWESIRNATKAGKGIEKCVFMCDFSGSMEGMPKQVSLALGILGSELAESAFANHILTFDAEPRWHSFAGRKTLEEKVKSIGNLGQGLNTDFHKACNLILRKLIENKVPANGAPTNLIVLTDMGFDRASDTSDEYVKKGADWGPQFAMIRKSFKAHGYKPPRIVCWNLRAAFNDFHSKADEIGVVNLSGWSASAFKILQTEGVDALTPAQMVRKILDAPRYDPVRKVAQSIFMT